MDQGRYFAKRSPAITYKPYDACTLCSEKNTHSHFLSYLHEWCV